MKHIPLTQDKYAQVDDEDFDIVSCFDWHYSTFGYALCSTYIDGDHVVLRMHRLINKTPSNMFTDHINGNKLDNRKCNLRSVNKSQNAINYFRHNKTGYRGVEKRGNSYRATILVEGKRIRMGSRSNIIDAAMDYDFMAKNLHGNIAVLNFPM